MLSACVLASVAPFFGHPWQEPAFRLGSLQQDSARGLCCLLQLFASAAKGLAVISLVEGIYVRGGQSSCV